MGGWLITVLRVVYRRVKLLFVWGVKSTPYAGVEVPHSGCFGRQDALYPDRLIM